MILVRDVFQAKYGKGDELVALFKEIEEDLPGEAGGRILTDLSGPFFTVVETEVESLAEYERWREEFFSEPRFAEWFARMVPWSNRVAMSSTPSRTRGRTRLGGDSGLSQV